MQLTLPTTFAQPCAPAGPVPPRGSAALSREAVALSQLDRIAAQNLRTPAHGLGSSAMLLALLGGLVVLGSASMWRVTAGEAPRAAVVAESRPAAAAVTSAPPALAAVVSAATAPSVAAVPAAAPPAVATPEPVRAAVAAAEPAADDAARKARTKQLADARRKAAQLAQERAAADEAQRLQLAQQRQAERVQQQLAEQARQRAAAEQARSLPIQLALDTRRNVSDACSATSGPISRHFCRARECGKAEHQGDAVCVALREDDLARQRASNDR